MRRRFDLGWALLGYMRCPNDDLRYVHGLDAIARDIVLLRAAVIWTDEDPAGRCACCDWRSGTVFLAPWLAQSTPPFLRAVLRHELGHVAWGPADERRRWFDDE